MHKKILVTGTNGQLGSELREAAPQYPNWEFVFTDKEELDITNKDEIQRFFSANEFDFCINAAAYTAVDKAEEEMELAELINHKAASYLTDACSKSGTKLIHISTDFVFSGSKNTPYTELDVAEPVNYYGTSKLKGEQAVLKHSGTSLVIRTSWLYSTYGANFVKTMLRLGKERDALNVIYDQLGTPTYAADLANCILGIIESSNFVSGIYHFSNEGVASWYDFAHMIFDEKNIDVNVSPILTEKYPTPAKRPVYSVMDKEKIKQTYGVKIPYWKDSLVKCLKKIEI